MIRKNNNKKRFNSYIQSETYDKINNFIKENELITSKLTPGTVLEISLNLFFKELETRSLENITVEYLTKEPRNKDGVFE